MRKFLFLFFGLTAFAAADSPWKASLSLGATVPTDGPESFSMRPFVEAGLFVESVSMDRPGFYDLGGRVQWDQEGLALLAGTRHKLYFSPWASTAQEVLGGIRWGRDHTTAVLSGRFGGSAPWSGPDSPYPKESTDAALVWSLGWNLATGVLDSALGFSFGLGFGPGENR